MDRLLRHTDRGIYCEQADVYIDPWKPVSKAFITHAHSDHARPGSVQYICVDECKGLIQHRLNTKSIKSVSFGEEVRVNGVTFSFFPAGHIIGSAQIRVEYQGEVWVVSGDYKTEDDQISGVFEPVPCHTFITECTFGLPVFNWKPQREIFEDVNNWWDNNNQNDKISLVSAYSLGKAQRLINGLQPSIGKIFTHSAIESINDVIRAYGIPLKNTSLLHQDFKNEDLVGNIFIAPPMFMNSNWLLKFKNLEMASASGWMNLRGARRRRAVDKGFVLSDHADWNGLLSAIKTTGADKIIVTHGYVNVFSKYLIEIGYDAEILETEYEGESIENEND